MPQPARGGLRLARLGAVVAVCLGLAAGGHAVGGGGLPDAATLGLTLPLLGLVALWFTRRERSIATLFAVLAAAEAALHVVFHLAGQHVATLGPALLGHAAHGRPAFAGEAALMTHATGHHAAMGIGAGVLPTPSMAVAHLVATALTAIALGWGDRSLWAAARRLLPVLPSAPRAPRPSGTPSCGAVPPRLRPVDLLRLAPARGPPLAVRPA